MNWQDIPVRDWRIIHLNVVWLTTAMLFAGLILLFTQGLLQYNQRQLQPLQARLVEARTAADTAQTGLLAVQESKQRYAELEQRKVIGNSEHRLAWVEKFTAMKRSDSQLNLRYDIQAQRLLENSEPIGGSALYVSRMKLAYSATHEAYFSRLHQSLTQLPGWALPLRCEIARPGETEKRLAVTCEYEWLSIAPAPTAAAPQ